MASLSIAQGLARAYGQPKGREKGGKQEKGKRQGKNSGRKGKKLQGILLMIKQWNAFARKGFGRGRHILLLERIGERFLGQRKGKVRRKGKAGGRVGEGRMEKLPGRGKEIVEFGER